jgi:hypothetical protein
MRWAEQDKETSMKRLGLFSATTLTLLLTIAVLDKVGWFTSRAPAVSHRCIEIGACPVPQDAGYREAAARWRRAQPTHWRYCLLQR